MCACVNIELSKGSLFKYISQSYASNKSSPYKNAPPPQKKNPITQPSKHHQKGGDVLIQN